MAQRHAEVIPQWARRQCAIASDGAKATRDGETILGADGGGCKSADMKEDNDFRTGLKFLQKMDESSGAGLGVAALVKKDTDAFDGGNWRSTEGWGKAKGFFRIV